MKGIRIYSRLLLGALFIFSGFVKALDPLGSAYKFSDYFHAFGLDFMDSLSLFLAIFQAGFELVLGLVLILGYQKKLSYWVLLIFMSFFTVLTFILALTNPVTDCGCFGDAIIMTNWQTFFKNLIFMLFVLILFKSRNRVDNRSGNFVERSIILLFFAGSFLFSTYCLKHLPIIDFRPYDIGTFIPEEIHIPDEAPRDEYSTILYYKNLKTGNTEEFTLENYPHDTSNYVFENSESKLIKKGYEPPIHDFLILDPDGNDVTSELLDFTGYSLFFTSDNILEVDEHMLEECKRWANLDRLSDNFRFIPVTSSVSSTLNDHISGLNLDFDFYSGDEIMLKTMVRSNPGFILIKNGSILAKWAWRDFPNLETWNDKWPGVIDQFISQQNPEIQMLIEEGLMDDLNYNIVDFDRSANKIITLKHAERIDSLSWLVFLLTIVSLLFIVQFVPRKKPIRRA